MDHLEVLAGPERCVPHMARGHQTVTRRTVGTQRRLFINLKYTEVDENQSLDESRSPLASSKNPLTHNT